MPPTSNQATLNNDGSVTVDWSSVDGAKSYVVHYGDVGKTTKDAVYMGYSETDNFTLANSDVPAHVAGDKIYFYVQAFAETGTGANDVEKAAELNSGNHLGSEWSKVSSVTFA